MLDGDDDLDDRKKRHKKDKSDRKERKKHKKSKKSRHHRKRHDTGEGLPEGDEDPLVNNKAQCGGESDGRNEGFDNDGAGDEGALGQVNAAADEGADMMIGQKRKRLVRKTAAAEFTTTG
jgi:hypothetical protein